MGAFVVDSHTGERVSSGLEEGKGGGEGAEVASRGAVLLGLEVDVAFVLGHEDVLVTEDRGYRDTTGEVRRGPFGFVDNIGAGVIGWKGWRSGGRLR